MTGAVISNRQPHSVEENVIKKCMSLALSQPLCHGIYPRSSEPRCSRSWTFELVAVASGAVVVAGVRCSEKLLRKKSIQNRFSWMNLVELVELASVSLA